MHLTILPPSLGVKSDILLALMSGHNWQSFNNGWVDTKGEYLALKAASPVWKFLGEEGMPNVDYPEIYDKSAVGNTVAYYRRDNDHGISAIDWVWMLEFAEKYFNKE